VHQHLGKRDRMHHKLVDIDQSLHGIGVMGVSRVQVGDQRAGIGDDQSGHSSRNSFK
jgi:hypothetical protein